LSAELTMAQCQPQAEGLHRLRVQQALQRGQRDAHGGAEDQQALETAAEVLGLVVAIGMFLVGRCGGEQHHGQREQRPGQVDERLERVRQQADRAGEPPGGGLHGDGRQRHGDGQLQVGGYLHGRDSRGGQNDAPRKLP
jgi:hypothetical protein